LKQRYVDTREELLQHLEAEGDGFLSRIITGNETCVPYLLLLMKKYSRRCMSGCTDNHKNIFLEEPIHFVNTGGPVLNEKETM
jgi:hypothetical protein